MKGRNGKKNAWNPRQRGGEYRSRGTVRSRSIEELLFKWRYFFFLFRIKSLSDVGQFFKFSFSVFIFYLEIEKKND